MFDNNLRYRTNDVELLDSNNDKLYFDEDTYIMEAKYNGSTPEWFINYINDHKIHLVKFSKMKNIYEKI